MNALELYEAARKAAQLLPNGASITLSCCALEDTVRAWASLVGTDVVTQLVLWQDRSPTVIYSAHATIEHVNVGLQGERPATQADSTEPATRHRFNDPVLPSVAQAEIAKAAQS